MLSRRLKYRFTKRGYAHLRMPSSRLYLPTQTATEMHQLSLYDCCLMAGLSSPSKTRHGAGISHKAIRAVAQAQARQMRLNSYHNQRHIGQVIIAAGLLADEANISQIERDTLIVAALIHDYNHLGRRRHKSDFWQEIASCDAAIPRLIRGGLDSRLVGLFYEMVAATSLTGPADETRLKGNDILSLLLDADLFASLFLPKREVDRLTAQLKDEDRLAISCEALRDGFLKVCGKKGFASLAGQKLHDALGPHMTYFEAR